MNDLDKALETNEYHAALDEFHKLMGYYGVHAETVDSWNIVEIALQKASSDKQSIKKMDKLIELYQLYNEFFRTLLYDR